MLLQGVENVKIDVGANADDLVIDDLLDTSVRTVDLQLGSAKAKMWQADRAVDGSFQVYPDSFSNFTGDRTVRTASYFYRYDLAPGGTFVFNADGSPKLDTVTSVATVDASVAKRARQTLDFAEIGRAQV